MKKKHRIRWLYPIANLLWLAFIFGHSLQSVSASQQTSLEIGSAVNSFLEVLSIPLVLSDHVIRKMAHFFEFFLLGILFVGWLPLLKKPILPSVTYVLFGGLLAAVTDEYIQFFSGRGSLVTDVVLDFSAVVTAVLLFVLASFVRTKRKAKSKGI